MSQVRLIKDRLLYFYSLLAEGKVIYKEEEAKHFNCSTRSILRDVEDIRAFLHDQSEKTGYVQDLVYDRKVKGYRLQPAIRQVLSNEEVFAVLKMYFVNMKSHKKASKIPFFSMGFSLYQARLYCLAGSVAIC